MDNYKKRDWMTFAYDDLRVAEIIVEEGMWNLICFHSQQCVEKVLKAYIEFNGVLPQKTHNLSELLLQCTNYDKDLLRFKKACDYLNLFYAPTRYPDALPGMLPDGLPTQVDANESLASAKEIFNYLNLKMETKK